MDLNVSLQSLNLSLHFVVLHHQLLSLLTLVLQFSSELMVLKNGKSSCGLELLIVKRKEIGLCFLDLVEHLFPEFLSSLDLFPFFLVDLVQSLVLLCFEGRLQIVDLSVKFVSGFFEGLHLIAQLVELLVPGL